MKNAAGKILIFIMGSSVAIMILEFILILIKENIQRKIYKLFRISQNTCLKPGNPNIEEKL